MQKLLLGGALGLSLCASIDAAQTFTHTPNAGLWQVQNQLLVNGQDVLAQMQTLQAQVLSQLPPEQRQALAALMPKQNLKTVHECLSQAQADALKTPESWLARAKRSLPHCQVQLVSSDQQSVQVTGQCKDQQGYTGDLAGTVTLVSPSLLQMRMRGKGQFQLPSALAGGMQGPVQFELRCDSRHQAEQCAIKAN